MHPPGKFDCPGKEIAFIAGTELLARYRERRAGYSTRKQGEVITEIFGVPDRLVGDVTDADFPSAVLPQRGGSVPIELHGEPVLETSELEAQGLSPSTCADLDDC